MLSQKGLLYTRGLQAHRSRAQHPPHARRNATALVKGAGNDAPILLDTRYLVAGKSPVLILQGVLLPDALPALRGNENFVAHGEAASAAHGARTFNRWAAQAILIAGCIVLAIAVGGIACL
jgi:hypothetical protein